MGLINSCNVNRDVKIARDEPELETDKGVELFHHMPCCLYFEKRLQACGLSCANAHLATRSSILVSQTNGQP